MSDTQGAQANAGAGNTAPPQGAAEVELTARRMGWKPKEEYKGDASNWAEPEAFIANRWDNLEAMRKTVIAMNKRFDTQGNELKEVKETLTDFKKFYTGVEQRAIAKARSDLITKRDVAVASADTAGFAAAQAEIDQLEKEVKVTVAERKEEAGEKTAAETTRAAAPDPAISSWMADNPWFNADEELHGAAQGIDRKLMKDHPGMAIADRLGLVTERIKQRFPDKFGNPRREAAASVGEPGGAPAQRSSNKRSYENLPPEAKKACDRFVKQKVLTREEYVKNYEWE